jgi:hypothetical protein
VRGYAYTWCVLIHCQLVYHWDIRKLLRRQQHSAAQHSTAQQDIIFSSCSRVRVIEEIHECALLACAGKLLAAVPLHAP